MKKLRILALMHEDLVPPDDLTGYSEEQINEWKTEFDVCSTLADLGHDVYKLGARDELRPFEATAQVLSRVVSPLLVGPFAAFRPIPAEQVAEAMVRMLTVAEPGHHVYESQQIATLYANTLAFRSRS